MTLNDDLMNALNRMGIKADNNAKEMSRKFEDLEKKVDSAKKEAREKEERDDKKLEKMNRRLDEFEKELKRNAEANKRKSVEKAAQKERLSNFKEAVGLAVVEPESPVKVKTWSELIEENKEKERARRDKAKEVELKNLE